MHQFDHALIYVPAQEGLSEGRFYDPSAQRLETGALPVDLVGTRAVEYRGRDPTGKRVSEAFYGTTLEEALQTYQSVIDSREPLFRDDPMQREDYKQIREERLFLPFSEYGETVDLILVYISERPT